MTTESQLDSQRFEIQPVDPNAINAWKEQKEKEKPNRQMVGSGEPVVMRSPGALINRLSRKFKQNKFRATEEKAKTSFVNKQKEKLKGQRPSREVLDELTDKDSKLSGVENFFREVDTEKQVALEIISTLDNPALPEDLRDNEGFKKDLSDIKEKMTETLNSGVQNQDYLDALVSQRKRFFELLKGYHLVYNFDRSFKDPENQLVKKSSLTHRA